MAGSITVEMIKALKKILNSTRKNNLKCIKYRRFYFLRLASMGSATAINFSFSAFLKA